MEQYDVVVVGAGNAGLSAASQMALAGKKTLLIEQHNLPGGCATSFRRGRFEIEPSLHELCDLGPEENPGDMRHLFDAYGIQVQWNRVPDCFRIITTASDGSPMDVTMPSGVDAFIDAMERYVPGSREKMRDLFDLFQEILDGIAYITASGGRCRAPATRAPRQEDRRQACDKKAFVPKQPRAPDEQPGTRPVPDFRTPKACCQTRGGKRFRVEPGRHRLRNRTEHDG